MIADAVRTNAYDRALRRAVRPGSVVVDIGTGTGIFALLAARYGARRVYAIEPSDAIQVAREIAADNGCSERIEFIQDLSTNVVLPERADLIVSDMRGVLPPFQQHLPSITDARQRFLAPGGVLVPRRDNLWAAIVAGPDLYRDCQVPWVGNPFGVDMRAGLQIVTNSWRKERVQREQLLSEPRCWATLDYVSLGSPDVSGEVVVAAARAGTAHGMVVWFDSELHEDIGFSNAPGKPELIYGQAFFPWSEPVELTAGDSISVGLQAHLSGEEYLWQWATRVVGAGAASAGVKAEFRQSTFFGAPLSSKSLRKRSESHVPTINEEGQVDRFVLDLMAGNTALGEIARQVSSRFPARFPTVQRALDHVGELSGKYSR